MKRYRVLSIDFDTRARMLEMEINPTWEEKVKTLWENNKRQIKEELIAEFGPDNAPLKIQNFLEIGILPISVITFHNKFFHQARDAFIIGAYYPALTATCALGERILNQLILHLRKYYQNTPEYKKTYRKKSFDNWDIAIDTLEAWDILLQETVELFRKLKDIRNSALHFNPETDTNDRELALIAIKLMNGIIERQFSGFGTQPWFIPDIKGATFIKREYEAVPFVKEIILPSSYLVGYLHTIERENGAYIIHDECDYDGQEITDEQFAILFNNREPV